MTRNIWWAITALAILATFALNFANFIANGQLSVWVHPVSIALLLIMIFGIAMIIRSNLRRRSDEENRNDR